jgi:hypothetical protein
MEDGWHPDPFGIHEERLFKGGDPTPLVRDDGIGSVDAVPLDHAGRRFGEGRSDRRPEPRRRIPPLVPIAGLLIAVGLVVGVIGFFSGGGNKSATTLSPLAREFLTLPPTTTMSPLERALRALPPTTVLTPLERELQALPRSTTPPPTSSPPPASSTPATTSPRSASASPGNFATRATLAPAPRPSSVPTPVIVPTTALPLTTLTTSVGQADQGWYLAYGAVFNTLQTAIEKLDRALGGTSTALYPTVHPYWQELSLDVGYARTIPPLPDGATQSEWASALAALDEGATDSINGTPENGAMVQATFERGSALITTGTSQLDGALGSVQQLAAPTSGASRGQVRSWYRAHGAVFATLQTAVTRVNTAFASTSSPNYSTIDPSWQQLVNDARSALALAPIPDSLVQSYWSTALNDLVDGANDCLETSEALPPNLFDQGVALIASGTSYLSTTMQTVQGLSG